MKFKLICFIVAVLASASVQAAPPEKLSVADAEKVIAAFETEGPVKEVNLQQLEHAVELLASHYVYADTLEGGLLTIEVGTRKLKGIKPAGPSEKMMVVSGLRWAANFYYDAGKLEQTLDAMKAAEVAGELPGLASHLLLLNTYRKLGRKSEARLEKRKLKKMLKKAGGKKVLEEIDGVMQFAVAKKWRWFGKKEAHGDEGPLLDGPRLYAKLKSDSEKALKALKLRKKKARTDMEKKLSGKALAEFKSRLAMTARSEALQMEALKGPEQQKRYKNYPLEKIKFLKLGHSQAYLLSTLGEPNVHRKQEGSEAGIKLEKWVYHLYLGSNPKDIDEFQTNQFVFYARFMDQKLHEFGSKHLGEALGLIEDMVK